LETGDLAVKLPETFRTAEVGDPGAPIKIKNLVAREM